MNNFLNILYVDKDSEYAKNLINYLGQDFYKFEHFANYRNIEKIIKSNYDLILINIGTGKCKLELNHFIDFIRKSNPLMLKTPFLIIHSGYEYISNVKSDIAICEYIDKNVYDFYNKLESSIFDLVPKAILVQKLILNDIREKCKRIDKNTKLIKLNSEDIKEIKDKYISWGQIIETLGVLIGAFSLTISIIITIMIFLFKDNIQVGSGRIPTISLLLLVTVFLIFWTFLLYVVFKNRTMKLIDKLKNDFVRERYNSL